MKNMMGVKLTVTSFRKSYSVSVEFSKSDVTNIDENDIPSIELRAAIKEGIDKACRKTKGVYQTQPGTVNES